VSGRPHVVVMGDVLLDVDVDGTVGRLAPDAPVPVLDVATRRESPGGAGLAALLCAQGARVTLVAPLAEDDAGERVLETLRSSMSVVPLGHAGGTRRKVRLRTDGRSLLRVDDGGPGTPTAVPREEVAAALGSADAVLVSDYGAGTTGHPVVRELLQGAARVTRLVWDPHPRGADPVPRAALVTPNLSEARARGADDSGAPHVVGAALCREWESRAVCVTGGADGAFLVDAGDRTSYYPAPRVSGGDPCGAGDRFAATAVTALAGGSLLGEAVERAVVEASGWVAAGGAEGFRRNADDPSGLPGPDVSAPLDGRPGTTEELAALARRLRGEGRTLVATGGCFDIVHAGHVATLQAARRLGDRLVVLMNSDASVRRLKGPGRPVVEAADRARVLAALDCVDAIMVFDEDDPRRALDALAPDVWAKGGDYGATPLPEAEVVRRHGGRVVFLPYLGGRSTTSIIRRSELARQTTTTGEQ
jgi:D-beta-D-heptose 7-phosphate kinase / D-beta-D-heptose 1-phosphate adenosyltransferase